MKTDVIIPRLWSEEELPVIFTGGKELGGFLEALIYQAEQRHKLQMYELHISILKSTLDGFDKEPK